MDIMILHKQTTTNNKKNNLIVVLALSSVFLLFSCSKAEKPSSAKLAQYIEQGQSYIAQHQFKAALTAANNAVAAYPDKIEGYLILAKIYDKLGSADKALAVLKRYKKNKNSDYYFLLLESYRKNNKLISAKKLIKAQEKLLSQSPDKLTLEKALLDIQENKLDSALLRLKKIENNKAFTVDSLIGQARIFALKQQPAKALKILDKVFNIAPKNVESRILASYLYISEDKYVKAEKALSKALTLLPSSDIFTPDRINILQALTNVLTLQGRSSEALIYARILSEEFPDMESVNQNMTQATEYFKAKEYDKAKALLEKILNIMPAHKKASTLMGIILYAQGDIHGAQKYLSNIVDPENNSKQLIQLYAITQLKLNHAGDVLTMLDNTIAEETNLDTLSLYVLSAISQQEYLKAQTVLDKMKKLFPKAPAFYLLQSTYYAKNPSFSSQKSLSTLQEGLKQNPNDIRLQTAYLKTLVELNQTEKADQFVNELVKNNGTDTNILMLAAKYKLHKKEYALASTYLTKILSLSPDNIEAMYGLAKINQLNNDWSNANALYKKIIQIDPKQLKAYQGIIFSVANSGKKPEQENLELPTNANNTILSLALANYLIQKNNFQLAQKYIEKGSINLPPNLKNYVKNLNNRISYKRASFALLDKNYDEARKITLEQLKLSPKEPQFLALLATIEIKAKQFNEAQKIINQIAEILPGNPIINIYNAELALAQQNKDKAIELLQKEWSQTKNNKIAQKLYLLLKETDNAKADSFLAEWQSISPNNLLVMINTAISLQTKGDNAGALALYEKIIKLAPNQTTSLNNAAWLSMDTDLSKALKFAEQAYKNAPNNASVIDTYAWILFKKGDIKKAKVLIEKARALQPKEPNIKKHWQEINQN